MAKEYSGKNKKKSELFFCIVITYLYLCIIMLQRYVIILFCMFFTVLSVDGSDSVAVKPSLAVTYGPGTVLPMDEFSRKWMKPNVIHSLTMALHLPPSSPDAPHLSFGIRYGMNHDVRMHRDESVDLVGSPPADYVTQMGNNVTLFGTYERPWFSGKRWQVSTYMGTGLGYSNRKYNPRNQVDNELIGSHVSMYLTVGAVYTYRLSPHWQLRTGIDFSHHSNGALSCPNKGANYLGPFVGVEYCWNNQDCQSNQSIQSNQNNQNIQSNQNSQHKPRLFLDLTLGVGAKALDEEWQRTQFHVPPEDPDYRTDKFRLYAAYSVQAAMMWRYGNTRATGLGLDLLYGTYSHHVKKLDEAEGHFVTHSPWSVAIAARHNVSFKRFTARFGLGYYLYRRMGVRAKSSEQPFYERIGVHYTIPRLHGLSVGFQVKTHIFRSDLTELQVAMPIRIGRK